MLPTAFQALTDPCLPDFWTDTYTAAPGAITMASAIIIFCVEFGSTRYLSNVDSQIVDVESPADPSDSENNTSNKVELHANKQDDSVHFGHHHIAPPPVEGAIDAHTAATQKLGLAILEAGIIFHSVFIGLTLAVSTGSNFSSLFITIIFHRMSTSLSVIDVRNIRRSCLGKSYRNSSVQT